MLPKKSLVSVWRELYVYGGLEEAVTEPYMTFLLFLVCVHHAIPETAFIISKEAPPCSKTSVYISSHTQPKEKHPRKKLVVVVY